MSARMWWAAGLCFALPLAGCGMKGDLTPAAPLFGEARAQYEADRAAAAETVTTTPDGRQRMEIPVAPAGEPQATPTPPATPPAIGAPATAPGADPKPE